MQTTLFWLRMVQLLIAVPLLAIAGQGLVMVMTRAFAQDPGSNFFYRLLAVVGSPVTRTVRLVTPGFVADRHVPLAAFLLLAVAYAWTMIAIADVCIGAGMPVAQCLRAN